MAHKKSRQAAKKTAQVAIPRSAIAQRLQNFAASTFFIAALYIACTRIPYFRSFFSDINTLKFLEIQFSFTTFDVWWIFLLTYIPALFFYYLLVPQDIISKSMIFFHILKQCIVSPRDLLQQGLTRNQRTAILALVVKGFFAPLMIAWLATHIVSMFNHLDFVIANFGLAQDRFIWFFQTGLYWFLFQTILFCDVLFFTLGYLIESPGLNNEIRSVDPYITGWLVTLLCYPPFNTYTAKVLSWNSTDFPYFENPYIFIGFNVFLLACMAIFSWASVALNFKASNLTHRGIVARGPYAYVRHPAYIAKNIAWWIGAIPALILAWEVGTQEVLLVALSVCGWSMIYFFRAITEERHLRSVDEEYNTYMKQVPHRFIPELW